MSLKNLISPANAQFVPEFSLPTPSFVRITDLGEFVTGLIELILILASLIVTIFLLWGGVQWITSSGDKAKIQEARDKITAALIGLAIVAIVFALNRIIVHFLGIGLEEGTTVIGEGGPINP